MWRPPPSRSLSPIRPNVNRLEVPQPPLVSWFPDQAKARFRDRACPHHEIPSQNSAGGHDGPGPIMSAPRTKDLSQEPNYAACFFPEQSEKWSGAARTWWARAHHVRNVRWAPRFRDGGRMPQPRGCGIRPPSRNRTATYGDRRRRQDAPQGRSSARSPHPSYQGHPRTMLCR